MKSPEDLAAQITERTSDQLVEMLKRPDAWLPSALEMARAELQRRSFDTSTISPEPPPAPLRHLFNSGSWPETLVAAWLAIVALAVGFSYAVNGYHFVGWLALSWGFFGAGIATCIVAGLFLLDRVRFQSYRKAYAIASFAGACIISLVIPIVAHWLTDAIAPRLIPNGYGMLALFEMVVVFWVVVAAFALFTLCFFLRFPLRRAKPRTDDQYIGPRCVACRNPISADLLICPKCGWTQPR